MMHSKMIHGIKILTMPILKAFYALLAFHLAVAAVLLLMDRLTWLLNFEVGFFVAAVIIYNSYKSYAKFVQSAVDNNVAMHYEDAYEKIDDPHGLYDEEETQHSQPSKKDQLKQTLHQTKQALPGSFSVRRILSYALLALAFVALQNNHKLDISGLLTGISAGSGAAIWMGKKSLLRNEG